MNKYYKSIVLTTLTVVSFLWVSAQAPQKSNQHKHKEYSKEDSLLLKDFNDQPFIDKSKESHIAAWEVEQYLELKKEAFLDSAKGGKWQKKLLPPNPTPQSPGQPCDNVDFEYGALINWDCFIGSYGNCLVTMGNTNAVVAGRHNIMTGGNFDPQVGGVLLPEVDPQGGIFSCRLGNAQTGAEAERIEQTFMVTNNTTSFTYRYAVVLNDPQHDQCNQPRFTIDMLDSNGQPINCAAYDVSAGQGVPGFVSYGNGNGQGIWKNWTTVNIDLTGYVNQNVTIRFTTADCGYGGHYGYAYLDGSCLPFYIVASDTLCDGECVNLIAPPGAASYLWSGPGNANGATTQIINTCVPGLYTVQSTSVTGCPNPTLQYVLSLYPDPTAAITAAPIPCTLTVNFTDVSTIPNNFNNTTITNWFWDFGDGNTSNTQNPSHTYNAPGNYNVLLAVTTANGCRDTITLQVAVFDNPMALFTATTVCQGTATQFTDQSTTTVGVINQWAWDFDNNGTTDNATQNPAYVFPNAGTFLVKLIVTNSFGCMGDTLMSVTVHPNPTAIFTAPTVCQGTSTLFTDQSTIIGAGNNITTWIWNYGDGTPNGNIQNTTHTYALAGTYLVTLTVTTNNGCNSTIQQNVIINPNPIADFTFNVPCLGQSTIFTDISTVSNGNNINTWSWNFGDGNNSNIQNTQHTYINPGNYNVTLTVTTNNGCTSTITYPIVVNPTANAVFIYTTVCQGTVTQFTDQSTVGNGNTITGWAWDFNADGITDDMNQNPTYVFPTPGSFIVMLTVTTNNGCQGQIVNQVTVNPNPVAAFTQTNVCLGTVMQFTDASTITNGNTITSWSWDFENNGSIDDNSQNPTYNYGSVGTYTVVLTVISNNGCVGTISQQVTVHPNPTALFIGSTECFGTATVFTDQSTVIGAGNTITNWTWDFNNDGVVDNNTQNPTYVFPSSGTYTTQLTVTTNNGCTTLTTLQIVVNPAPNPNFTASSVCLNNLTSFTDGSVISNGNNITGWDWDFGDGTPHDNTQNPVHMYVTAGTYQVKLVSTSNNGCPSDTTISVTVHPLPVAGFTATDVCLLQTMNFTDISSVNGAGNTLTSWDWDFGDGSAHDLTQNPSHLYTTDGVYNITLIVTTNNGCKDTTTKQVMVYPNPVTTFTGTNLSGCGPVNAIFTDGTTISSGTITGWDWDFGDGTSHGNTQNPAHSYTTPGTYTVTLTTLSDKGCASSFTVTDMIHVYPYPIAEFIVYPQPTTIHNPKITFTDISKGAIGWTWDFGDITPNDINDVSSDQNPLYLYRQPGTYEPMLIVTNQFGCTDTITLKLTIGPDFSFYVPNAFTPNGDGVNNGFNGKGEGIAEYEMNIFDRWGELIFHSNSLTDNWDGVSKFRATQCQQDVYVYKIRIKTIFGESFDYVGSVTLVR